jgi:hypothetical protein
MTYVITEPCIDLKDKTCVDECPVETIFYEDGLPEQWAQFTTENVRFFDQLGSPGGASSIGPLLYDTDYVASYITTR